MDSLTAFSEQQTTEQTNLSVPLPLRQLRNFLKNTYGEDLSDDFADWLHQQTNGQRNQLQPLLTRALKQGILKADKGRWTIDRTRWNPSLNLSQLANRRFAENTHLPLPSNQLVGRRKELAAITAKLEQSHLVSLLGLGGAGKTRLALQTAYHHLNAYDDGVFFVNLAGVAHSIMLLPTLVSSLPLQLHGTDEPKEQLLEYLKHREILLILDNYEQFLPDTTLISDIVAQAPSVSLLVTTRARLGLRAEAIVDLGGLSLDSQGGGNQESEAAHFFVNAAMRADPNYVPHPDELSHIEALCKEVSGLPLGIELAAAWVRMLPVQAIVQELTKGIDILAGSYTDADDRHQSLEAAFDYSWNLLTEDEQRIFCQLSLFAGPFDYNTAIEVTQGSLMTLRGLVDKSLIQLNEVRQMQLHPLLRQYAAKHLAKSSVLQQDVAQRHASYFMVLLQQQDERISGAEILEALNWIDESLEDIRTAWDWTLEAGDFERLIECSYPLAYFYETRSRFFDGFDTFTATVNRLSKKNFQEYNIYLRMRTWKALFMRRMNLNEASETLAREALSEANAHADLRWQLLCLSILAPIEIHGKHDRRISTTKSLKKLALELNNQNAYSIALSLLVQEAMLQKNVEVTRGLQTELKELAASTSNPHIEASVSYSIANIIAQFDEVAAEPYYYKGLDAATRCGDKSIETRILLNLANIKWNAGDFKAVLEIQSKAYNISRITGSQREQAHSLLAIGYASAECGDFMSANQRFDDATKLCEVLAEPRTTLQLICHQIHLYTKLGAYDIAENLLSSDAFGYLDENDDVFLESELLVNQARLLMHQNKLGESEAVCRRAFRITKQYQYLLWDNYVLTCLAHILLRSEKLDLAQTLFEELAETAGRQTFPYNKLDIYAGLAEIAYHQANHSLAVEYVDSLLEYMKDYSVDGTILQAQIYIICTNVLGIVGDTRKLSIAQDARRYVQERASKISKPYLYDCYINTLVAHQRILSSSWLPNKSENASDELRDNASSGLLTRRETEILQLIAENYSNQEIADVLVLSLATIKRHVYNIYQKLEVKRRGHAVARGQELGILN
ncbi:MAG: LuxR C-terminal-related transcriptional regulator [Chloroflexota bacterium]